MKNNDRIVTANLPDDLISRLDQVAERIDRTKSWIIREAIREWLAQEERRYQLTLEALKDIDEGQVISHEDILAWAEAKKQRCI